MFDDSFGDGSDVLQSAGKIIGVGALGVAGAYLLGRYIVKTFISQNLKKILDKPYEKNIIEYYNTLSRFNIIPYVELSMRAETGNALMRPISTPFPMIDFTGMRFKPAQLYRLPASNEVEVDTTLVLGKQAARPMQLDIPILIGGMAYGFALSKEAKLALAEAATKVGTATNTGDGPFTDWERAAAKHLIVQYPLGKWNRDPEVLRQADMIQIQIGQGAWAGVGSEYGWNELSPELRCLIGLKPGEDAVYHSHLPEVSETPGPPGAGILPEEDDRGSADRRPDGLR